MNDARDRSNRRSGLRTFTRVGVLALVTSFAGAGCQLVQSGPAAGPEVPVRAPDPPIRAGSISAGAQATAAQLLASARRAFEQGDTQRAAADANRVVTEFPSANGSSEALWILAQAAYANGDAEVALAAAERYPDIMPTEDRRAADATLLHATIRAEGGESDQAVAVLLAADPQRARLVESQANTAVREWVRDVETSRLGELTEGIPEEHPLLPPVWLEYGIGLHFAGEIDASAQVARLVLASDADASDREVARSLLTGSVAETMGSGVSVGVIVPTSGSPTLQQYAQDVEEGVRVALQMEAARRRRPVDLRLVDDGGDASMTQRGIQQLEEARAIAIVGPLLDRSVEAAASARGTRTALVSPTAGSIPTGTQGVYSLAAPDAGGVHALADYAADQGYQRLALIYPRTANSEWEAQSFIDAYSQRGSGRVERFPYEPGSTTFIDQLADAERFGVDVLVLPVPDSDVELLAPQVTFSGLDTLGVHVLGNASWGQDEVLRQIDPRHTDGVVIASPRSPEGSADPYAEFVQAYEALHRKTLRSPVPAFGFDAARLILNAIDRGARSPADLVSIFERTEDFHGATGQISVVDGRITRRHFLYEIRDRSLLPAGRRF